MPTSTVQLTILGWELWALASTSWLLLLVCYQICIHNYVYLIKLIGHYFVESADIAWLFFGTSVVVMSSKNIRLYNIEISVLVTDNRSDCHTQKSDTVWNFRDRRRLAKILPKSTLVKKTLYVGLQYVKKKNSLWYKIFLSLLWI